MGGESASCQLTQVGSHARVFPHRLWVLLSFCDCSRRLCWRQGSWLLWHQRFLQPKDRKAPTWVPA